MNSHRQEIKINYDSQEWITDFDGGIASVEVDGRKLYGHESWRDWIRDRALLFSVCVLVIGYTIGRYTRGNVVSDVQLEKIQNTAQISHEGAVRLHDAGVRWNQELRDWVWVGNRLAISSYDKDEISE